MQINHRKATKQHIGTIFLTFAAFLLVAAVLLTLICFLNFDQNYREVKQTYYAAQCDQIISDVETSLQYGKRLDHYFGIEEVLARTQALFDEDTVEAAVLSLDGRTLYSTYDADTMIARILDSEEGQTLVRTLSADDAYALLADEGYEVLVMPINAGEVQEGCFVLSYPTSVYAAQRTTMAGDCLQLFGIVFALGLAVLLIYFLIVRRRLVMQDESMRRVLLFGVPSGILLGLIFITGVANYALFQDRYEMALQEDVGSVVEYIGMMCEEVHDKGVAYEEMDGLDDYLAEKVAQMPMLEDLRISHILYDSSHVQDDPTSDIVAVQLDNGDQPLSLEAIISHDYVQEKMMTLFFVFLATFIFCVVIIVELIRLPEMIIQRRRPDFGSDDPASYEYFAKNVRILSFFQTMARYLYLPYSALLIMQWGQSVGGLSVGITASLPLACEYAAHAVAMAIFPKWVKYPDRRGRIFFSICLVLVVVVNLGCFLTHSAWVLILLRLLGGFAFAGFVYFMNIVTSAGEADASYHFVNQAQLNAGVIGGNMCGAGIAAVIVSLSGYSFAYVISAVVFAVFGLFAIKMTPWMLLEHFAESKKYRQ